MRIIDMRPENTPWKDGQQLRASSWSARDYYQSIGGHIRDIYHYSTHMIQFVGFEREFDSVRGEMTLEWQGFPVSIGHGSVSDQGGINQLLSYTTIYVKGEGCKQFDGYGYYMLRDKRGGGPRIMNTHTNEVVS